ncbi:DUF192 domain-containing protein [Inquilinus sp. CAU 1745]|uniref:DUF192 domain-containing protein n=1 Tax=Inquilinus sp. CAU 1745 TaxID=3140369 RepID=UPI00325AE08D
MRRFVPILLLLVLLPASGFAQSGQTFEKSRLTVETARGQSFDFDVELALTPAQQAQGLMHREEMAADSGMLFVFPRARPASFWMKNTILPLDIIFIGPDGAILNIAKRTTPMSTESVPSDGEAKAVLELNAGVTDLLNIRPGDRVVHELLENTEDAG